MSQAAIVHGSCPSELVIQPNPDAHEAKVDMSMKANGCGRYVIVISLRQTSNSTEGHFDAGVMRIQRSDALRSLCVLVCLLSALFEHWYKSGR